MQTEFYIKQQQLPKYGLNVKFSIDPPKTPLGTAGPIKRAEKLVGHEAPFLVLNGDIFADLSYKEMMESHKGGKAVATIALVRVDDPNRYGVAELAKDNRIKNFVEKPPEEKAPSNLINAGAYVLSPRIFDYIPKGKAVSMEREVFPKLAAEGKLYGHPVQGLWMDIGKPEEYLQTNKILADALYNKNKFKKANKTEFRKPVALDKGVTIGEESIIGPYAILGKNVTIGKGVEIRDSVIFPETRIDDYATIVGAIIGESAVIGKNVKIGKGCIVADHAKIHEGVQLEEDVAICPAKEVSEKMLKSKTVR